MADKRPIGVFDTGIGGFTSVREIQAAMPKEDIIYYGDTANMPYGDRSAEDIVHLTRQILDFMAAHQVKVVAVACNTISSFIDQCRGDYSFKIFSIVEAGAACASRIADDCIGVIGTPVTAKSGVYERLIHSLRPDMKVVSAACPRLSYCIENGMTAPYIVDPQLTEAIDAMSAKEKFYNLVLGCTHYPLIADHLERLYPAISLIDPAREQAAEVKEYLKEGRMQNLNGGNLSVYTSGDAAYYAICAAKFGVNSPCTVEKISVATPL